MKTNFFIFLALCFSFCLLNSLLFPIQAQTPMKNYASEWQKIDTLVMKQGLTRSALTAVNNIYGSALKEGNQIQVLKALIYQVMLEENVTENDHLDGIQKLEKNLLVLREPARSVLSNVIAERYWQYFRDNRWKFYNRTATTGFKKEDPATWAAEDFHSVITSFYLQSIKNGQQLQSTSLEPFDAIIIKGNVRNLRPTLYDLLAQRALNYFKNDERTITKPAYSFEIADEAAFAPAETFIRHTFATSDTLSPYYHAVLLFQKLMQLHTGDKTKDAFIDLDINRLEFIKDHAVMIDKHTLYQKALKHITDKFGYLPAASQAWFLQASIHAENARTYQPLINETHRFEWIKAKEICEKLVSQKDSSEGKANAFN
ncbi:MAG: alpha-2-macroglobulin, partial [Chitinophagaceae bacterium]